MRPSATTQLIYTQLNFLSPQKRVVLSLLHFGDWTKTMLESNQTTWLIVEDWPSPASQPGILVPKDTCYEPGSQGWSGCSWYSWSSCLSRCSSSLHPTQLSNSATIAKGITYSGQVSANLDELEWFWGPGSVREMEIKEWFSYQRWCL